MPHVFINLHQTIYYTNAGYDLSFVTLSLSLEQVMPAHLFISCLWVVECSFSIIYMSSCIATGVWGPFLYSSSTEGTSFATQFFLQHYPLYCYVISWLVIHMKHQIPLLPVIGWKYNGYCLVLFIVKSGESNYLNIQITTFRTSQVVFPPLYFTCVYWLCIS